MTFNTKLLYHLFIAGSYTATMVVDKLAGATGSTERLFLLILCLMIFYCWETLCDILIELEITTLHHQAARHERYRKNFERQKKEPNV
jgi:hypothetical protein